MRDFLSARNLYLRDKQIKYEFPEGAEEVTIIVSIFIFWMLIKHQKAPPSKGGTLRIFEQKKPETERDKKKRMLVEPTTKAM